MKNNNLFTLKNKKIVLTGCSGLLGSEFSDYFLKNGAIVIGIDIKDKNKFSKSRNFFFYKTDLANPKSIKQTTEIINKKFKNIDSLINNAAINEAPKNNFKQNFLNFNINKFDEFSNVNVKAILYLCKNLYDSLKKGKGGSIINIGSIYGLVSPDQELYNTSQNLLNQKNISYTITKTALLGLTRHLAIIFAKDKIRVNSTSLGGTKYKQDKSFVRKYERKSPMKRLAKKNEFNGLVNFLISESSSYITGANFVADGGWTSI